MARLLSQVYPLTPERAAFVDGLEVYIEGMLGSIPPGPDPIVIALPATPDAAVAAELRRRYLAAGWSSVTVGAGPGSGGPFIQLERTVNVLLSGRNE